MSKEEMILEAAGQLFLEYGYKKTTLDDIADKLGIQKGGIYYYYKGKEELFLAVLKRKHMDYAERTVNLVEAQDNFKDKLIAYGMAKVDYIIEFSNTKFNFFDDIISNSNLPSNRIEYFIRWERSFIQDFILGSIFKGHDDDAKLKQMTDLIQMENAGIAQLFNIEHDFERLKETAKYHLTLIAIGLEHELNQGGLL